MELPISIPPDFNDFNIKINEEPKVTVIIPTKNNLKQAIIHLLEDPDYCQNLGKQAHEFVKEKAVLALGEVTGHSHQILQPVWVKKNREGLAQELIIEQPVELTHEEHETLLLPVGEAMVMVQRELDLAGEVRQVLD
jgi:hypothetical protein